MENKQYIKNKIHSNREFMKSTFADDFKDKNLLLTFNMNFDNIIRIWFYSIV